MSARSPLPGAFVTQQDSVLAQALDIRPQKLLGSISTSLVAAVLDRLVSTSQYSRLARNSHSDGYPGYGDFRRAPREKAMALKM